MQPGDFYPLIGQAFEDAGVIFVILPNLPGSGINGATKKIRHIINGDYGITFENELNGQEDVADKLIPLGKYEIFVSWNELSVNAIRGFAEGLTEIRVLFFVAYKKIKSFHLQMIHYCQKH